MRGNDLWRVAADGASALRVGRGADAKEGAQLRTPFVLPGDDAALVTVTYNVAESPRVGVVTFADSSLRVLDLEAHSPRYGDGLLIAEGEDGSLLAVPFSPKKRALTGASFTVLPRGTVRPGDWSLSETGTLAYVTYTEPERQLMLVEPDGTAHPLSADTANFRYPRVSPDGQRIAVTVAEPNRYGGYDENWDTRVYNLKGARVVQLANVRAPEWSPDGSSLYVTIRPHYLRRKDLVGRGDTATVYAGPAPVWHATPLADGSFIMRIGGGTAGPQRIVHYAPAHSPSIRDLESNANGQAISPDGAWLAFVKASQLFVRPLGDAAAATPISTNGGSPVWSSDGRRLYYRSGALLMGASLSFGVHAELIRKDTIFNAADYESVAHQSNFAVLPNGRFVMPRIIDTSSPKIVVVLNWLDEVRALLDQRRK